MDFPELVQAIPDLVRQHVTGGESIRAFEATDERQGGWAFRRDRGVVVLVITGGEMPLVWTTAGLVTDVPYSSKLVEYVNHLNAATDQLTFGRMFVAGDIPFMGGQSEQGPCSVFIRDNTFGDGLSFDFTPPLQNLVDVIGNIGREASYYANELLERFGGRLFTDEEASTFTRLP